MTIKELQDEIIETFELFETWEEKYGYIIDMGRDLKVLDDQYKIPENIIKGCQSTVWLHSEFEDGILSFYGDSDALIVKGLVGMLLHVLSGHKPDEILNNELYFIEKTGLSSHLAQTRANGLASMVKQIRAYALAYKTLEEQKGIAS